MCNDNFMFNRELLLSKRNWELKVYLYTLFYDNFEKDDREFHQKLYSQGLPAPDTISNQTYPPLNIKLVFK